MQRKSFSPFIACIAAASLISTTAYAVDFNFNQAGQTSAFGWNGQSPAFGHTGTDNQNMGSPTVNSNGFFFINEFGDMNYVVNAGTPNINSQVEWAASTKGAVVFGQAVQGSNPGGAAPITQIIVRESGTFVSQDPQADFSITQSFGIQFFDPSPPFPFNIAPYAVSLPQPTFDLINGTWQTEITIDITTLDLGGIFAPAGADTMAFDLTNIIALSPEAATSASITKTRAEIFTPEPGTLCLLGLGLIAVGVRRRRLPS